MTLQQTYDFIVVGAGSAGAAAAARLSQDGQHSVLLLEAGPLDTNIWTRLPMGVAKVLSQGKLLRHYFTEPDPQMKNRKIYWPRGWVVGGSSTVNGMIWVQVRRVNMTCGRRMAVPVGTTPACCLGLKK